VSKTAGKQIEVDEDEKKDLNLSIHHVTSCLATILSRDKKL